MRVAICYFAYKRSDKVKITLNALLKCRRINEVDIVIFQDNFNGEVDCMQVEITYNTIMEIINKSTHPNIRLIQWKEHVGSEISLIKGTEYLLKKNDCAIRIEEDIEVREDFLEYMLLALERYKEYDNIFAICSFNPAFVTNKDIFIASPFRVWGCGFYAEKFFNINWDKNEMYNQLGKKDYKKLFELFPYSKNLCKDNLVGLSWDYVVEDRLIMYHCYVNDLKCVYPNCSYVRNIGFDGSGVHSGYNTKDNLNFYKKIKLNFDDYYLSDSDNIELINATIKSYHLEME